jgi:hypothetical protein
MFPFNPLIYIDSKMYSHCLFIATHPLFRPGEIPETLVMSDKLKSCVWPNSSLSYWIIFLQKYFIKTDWIKDISNQWPLDLVSFHFVLFSKQEDLLRVRKFCYYPNLPKPIQGQNTITLACLVYCMMYHSRHKSVCTPCYECVLVFQVSITNRFIIVRHLFYANCTFHLIVLEHKPWHGRSFCHDELSLRSFLLAS